MDLVIKKMGINGEGIGYDNRIPIFVMGALPEDVVECKVIENKGRYKIAELIKVKKPSPARVIATCSIQKECGGCPLMTLTYEEQLKYKRELLIEALKKYAGDYRDLVEEIVGCDSVLGYRNQCKLPVKHVFKRLHTGMYQVKTNRFIPMEKCAVHEPEMDQMRIEIMKILNERHYRDYDEKTRRGIRHIVLRQMNKKIQCTLVTGQDTIDEGTIKVLCGLPNLGSLYQNSNLSRKPGILFGKQWAHLGLNKSLVLEESGLKLKLSAASFFQLNTHQAFRLYEWVRQLIKPCDLMVEAYCGIGGMSLLMHDLAQEVIGIEIIPSAVANATENAKLNKITNRRFLCGDAAEEITKISKKRKIDTLLIDPPRTGIDDLMIDCIMKSKINTLVYVSCNPATLAKDLSVLINRYEVQRIIPIDMFPNTAHVECVTLLSRLK